MKKNEKKKLTAHRTAAGGTVRKRFHHRRRKHLKSGRTRSKEGHMATPIDGQSSKSLESVPNQVHTVFGWELKIIDLKADLHLAARARRSDDLLFSKQWNPAFARAYLHCT